MLCITHKICVFKLILVFLFRKRGEITMNNRKKNAKSMSQIFLALELKKLMTSEENEK